MIKFLMTVTCEREWKFEENKIYEYIEDFDNKENADYILVKQPNSPKGKNWYSKIARIHEGKMFEFIN